jgi:PPOX class probable F420-dependent enzyme
MVSDTGAGLPVGWARERFAASPVARLATVRPDGRPHVVPITFALTTTGLVTAVDHKPKRSTDLQRLRNIAAQPAVSVLVDGYDDDWNALWWVRLDGPAHIHDDPATRTDMLRPLIAKYDAYTARPPAGPVIVVTVESWSSWSATSEP